MMNRDLVETVLERGNQARLKYGPYSSLHEVHGVLMEEFHEATVELHRSNWMSYRGELLDIAAVCIRCANETTIREESKQI